MEIFQKEMELFKHEYQEKIMKIKKKLHENHLSMSGSSNNNSNTSNNNSNSNNSSTTTNESNTSSIITNENDAKVEKLERTIHGLLAKLSNLKEENKAKDQMIQHYKVSYNKLVNNKYFLIFIL